MKGGRTARDEKGFFFLHSTDTDGAMDRVHV